MKASNSPLYAPVSKKPIMPESKPVAIPKNARVQKSWSSCLMFITHQVSFVEFKHIKKHMPIRQVAFKSFI
jgi:hypothetical protein